MHLRRGLKQGNPPSPTIFIIITEVLAKGLNNIKEDIEFIDFGLPRWSEKINNLSYSDDSILFYSRQRKSVKKMMKVMRSYENVTP